MAHDFRVDGVDYTGNLAYKRMLGMAGANKATATPFLFDVNELGEDRVIYLPPGVTTLTLQLARSGLLVSDNPGATTLYVPRNLVNVTMSGTTYNHLNFTRPTDGSREPTFRTQRRGAGTFNIVWVTGVVCRNLEELDQTNQPRWNPQILHQMIGVDEWIAQ